MTSVPAITGATGLDTGLSRTAGKDSLAKAGQKFEAAFDGMMLKAMRATKLADPLFDSKAIDTFTDMQDQRLAQSMAEHSPIGIGKAMTDFLQKSAVKTESSAASQDDLNTGQPSPNQ